jgi:hypothetical protein
MNFDGWKGIKKLMHYTKEKGTVIHKPEMEEKSTEGKYVEELESSSPPANSNMEQIPEDLRPTEQPSTLKEVASIKEDSINKNQLSSSNISTQVNNDNYVLLNELPEQWIGKEMNLHVITDRKDAIWIINRIFQDVETVYSRL